MESSKYQQLPAYGDCRVSPLAGSTWDLHPGGLGLLQGTNRGGGTAMRAEPTAGDATATGTTQLLQLDGAEGSPEPQEGVPLLR